MNDNLLNITAADIMVENVLTIQEQRPVSFAIEEMTHNNVGIVLIVDNKNNFLGVFSERDYIRRVVTEEKDIHAFMICEVMTEDVVTVSKDTNLIEMLGIMAKGLFRHLPVIENGEIFGIISVKDINKVIYEKLK